MAALLPGASGVSVASPPSGIALASDVTRGRIAATAPVEATPRTGVTAASYTLPPGTDAGWRTLPGTTILAVVDGTLGVLAADGCRAAEYKGGSVAILVPGRYLIHGQGNSATRFTGVLLGQKASSATGLGGIARARTACGSPAHGGALETADLARATFVGPEGYHVAHGTHAGHGSAGVGHVEAIAGKDLAVQKIYVEPGTSIGWHTHPGPVLVLAARGSVDYFDGADGRCVPAGHYEAGDAWLVTPYPGHRHIGFVPEVSDVYLVYLNLPSTFAAVPALGALLDGNDFTPLPPADCLRLRNDKL